jgi:hypothetical protein
MVRYILVALPLALAACSENHATIFPPGLETLGANQAKFPAGATGDAHPEAILIVTGETNDYVWVEAKAYVHAPTASTWEAMRTPEVCVDRRHVSSWTVTENVESGYDYSFVIHNTFDNVVTIQEDLTWRQSHIEGPLEDPDTVVAVYQKTNGSDYISRDAASFVARKIDGMTTSLELIGQLGAVGSGISDEESYIRDYYASIVAKAHGQPLPTY